MLAEALANGATEAVMEVSSHALSQQRGFGIPINVAVFTNLTRDHLDYHHTMDEYFDAKQALFMGCGTEPPRSAVMNIDDQSGQKLVKENKNHSQVFTYGLSSGDFYAKNIQITSRGTRFQLVTPGETIPIWSPLIGKVNVYNVLAAAGASHARSCGGARIGERSPASISASRAFERVGFSPPFHLAFVDWPPRS